MKPAWHEPFTPGALQYPAPRPLFGALTPEAAWGCSTGRGVRVAVVDSGIEAAHPAVGGMVRGGAVVVERDGQLVVEEEPHEDLCGHGTACAGIIHGLAPEAELYSVRVLGRMMRGKGDQFVAGLRWAVEQGMQVINLSLGSTKRDYYALLHELTDHAYYRNCVIVTAANNLPQPSFPSLYAAVISVACHQEQDPLRFYYNPAPPVDFGAPGINVRVAWLEGSYLNTTGNSFAAPHITGLVARILGKHPGLTAYEVKTILRATAWNVRHPPPDGAPTPTTAPPPPTGLFF